MAERCVTRDGTSRSPSDLPAYCGRRPPGILRDPHFLCHQPEQQIDVVPLPEEEEELDFMKGGQKPFGKLFPFDRHDTDGGVLRHACAKIGMSPCWPLP